MAFVDRPEKKPTSFIGSIGPALDYEYLGPGTDIRYKQHHNVQPKGTLDREAMKHDIAYADIREAYERGEISYNQALDKIDKADWDLFKGSAHEFYRYKAPNALIGVGKSYGGPIGTALGLGDALYHKRYKDIGIRAGAKAVSSRLDPFFQGVTLAGTAKKAVQAMPSAYTSAGMLVKLGLSKLGVVRGAYSGLDKSIQDKKVMSKYRNDPKFRKQVNRHLGRSAIGKHLR